MGYGSDDSTSDDSTSDEEEETQMQYISRMRVIDDERTVRRMKELEEGKTYAWWEIVETIRDRFQRLSESDYDSNLKRGAYRYIYVDDSDPRRFFKLIYSKTNEQLPRNCAIIAYSKNQSGSYKQKKVFSWLNINGGSAYVQPIDLEYGYAGKRYRDDMPPDLVQVLLGYANLDRISEKDSRVKKMEGENRTEIRVTVDGYVF